MLIVGENMNLKEYLFVKKISITEFSNFMGYSRTHMSSIINGHLKPSRFMAKSIERATNGQVKAENVFKDDSFTEKEASVAVC